MRYAIDCEFIDTPKYSDLISLAIVREDMESRYFEFCFDEGHLTTWLKENVMPHLRGAKVTRLAAAEEVRSFIGGDQPEFWCYYGAYDWYWFCRLFGGFMEMPLLWPQRFKELAELQQGVPNVAGAEHDALADAKSIMAALKTRLPS